MSEVSTRTLRNYLASLPGGGTAGVVDQDLMIRTDIATTSQAVPAGGATGQVLAKVSGGNYDLEWSDAGSGDMAKAVYDPQGIEADAFDRANHTGTQPLSTISDAGTMAAEAAADYTKTADLGDAALLDVGTTAGTVAAGDHTHADATTSVPGFMSAADKAKLDDLRSGPYSRGHLWGLTLSNNASDATNDLDIAIGEARDETDTVTMVLASALTKRLDANWAAGTNQGGRYSGAAIADTTYHVWLVSKANGADVDVYLDPSAVSATVLTHLQAETGGASYLYVRRIGSILRVSAAIVAFTQRGDLFLRPLATDRNSASTASSILLTLSVPIGVSVRPMVGTLLVVPAGSDAQITVGDGNGGSAPIPINRSSLTGGTSILFRSAPFDKITTNTSGQIRFTQAIISGSLTLGLVETTGWIDTRGRLA